MDITYAEVGTEVILGRYNHPRWVWVMEPYVGKKTYITYVGVGIDDGWCHVAIDRGVWWWLIQNMILASERTLIRKKDPRFMGR